MSVIHTTKEGLEMKQICLVVVAIFSVVGMGWCGFLVGQTADIKGRVIDASTGHPIENVIVAVQWYRDFAVSIDPAAKKVAGQCCP